MKDGIVVKYKTSKSEGVLDVDSISGFSLEPDSQFTITLTVYPEFDDHGQITANESVETDCNKQFTSECNEMLNSDEAIDVVIGDLEVRCIMLSKTKYNGIVKRVGFIIDNIAVKD